MGRADGSGTNKRRRVGGEHIHKKRRRHDAGLDVVERNGFLSPHEKNFAVRRRLLVEQEQKPATPTAIRPAPGGDSDFRLELGNTTRSLLIPVKSTWGRDYDDQWRAVKSARGVIVERRRGGCSPTGSSSSKDLLSGSRSATCKNPLQNRSFSGSYIIIQSASGENFYRIQWTSKASPSRTPLTFDHVPKDMRDDDDHFLTDTEDFRVEDFGAGMVIAGPFLSYDDAVNNANEHLPMTDVDDIFGCDEQDEAAGRSPAGFGLGRPAGFQSAPAPAGFALAPPVRPAGFGFLAPTAARAGFAMAPVRGGFPAPESKGYSFDLKSFDSQSYSSNSDTEAEEHVDQLRIQSQDLQQDDAQSQAGFSERSTVAGSLELDASSSTNEPPNLDIIDDLPLHPGHAIVPVHMDDLSLPGVEARRQRQRFSSDDDMQTSLLPFGKTITESTRCSGGSVCRGANTEEIKIPAEQVEVLHPQRTFSEILGFLAKKVIGRSVLTGRSPLELMRFLETQDHAWLGEVDVQQYRDVRGSAGGWGGSLGNGSSSDGGDVEVVGQMNPGGVLERVFPQGPGCG